jgi:hypothetical protein
MAYFSIPMLAGGGRCLESEEYLDSAHENILHCQDFFLPGLRLGVFMLM